VSRQRQKIHNEKLVVVILFYISYVVNGTKVAESGSYGELVDTLVELQSSRNGNCVTGRHEESHSDGYFIKVINKNGSYQIKAEAGIFIAACFISLSIGTSVGTIVALTPVAVGLAEKTEIALPFMVAVVVGGSYTNY